MNLNLSGSENCTDKYDKGIKKSRTQILQAKLPLKILTG